MFCLLYSPKQKNCINTKSHVIDIFTSEDMENISLYIFQYLILYYIINRNIDIFRYYRYHVYVCIFKRHKQAFSNAD